MAVRPLRDHVLVRRLEAETTKRGVIIPDTARETSQQAVVIAVGKGGITESGDRVPSEVKKGDRVLVRKYAGTEIEIEGKEYLVVAEAEILGMID